MRRAERFATVRSTSTRGYCAPPALSWPPSFLFFRPKPSSARTSKGSPLLLRRRGASCFSFSVPPLGISKTTKGSEEHTSELQSLMRISYAVFCLKKKKKIKTITRTHIKRQRKHKCTSRDKCEIKQDQSTYFNILKAHNNTH